MIVTNSDKMSTHLENIVLKLYYPNKNASISKKPVRLQKKKTKLKNHPHSGIVQNTWHVKCINTENLNINNMINGHL